MENKKEKLCPPIFSNKKGLISIPAHKIRLENTALSIGAMP
jgi:hypothetical protein